MIKVSQELKSKELMIGAHDYQLVQEREMMRKELIEMRERKGKLEMIEGDLIHKLETKEGECDSMKMCLQEMQEKT